MPADEPDEEEPRTMLTFAQAAERLVTEEHVRSMGPEGLRKLARTDPEWPLGPGDYGSIAGARTLPYEVVVQYIKTRSKRPGRGPARKRRHDPPPEPPAP